MILSVSGLDWLWVALGLASLLCSALWLARLIFPVYKDSSAPRVSEPERLEGVGRSAH